MGDGPPGLSADELLHFKEKGWVKLDAVLTPQQCAALREAADSIIDEGWEYVAAMEAELTDGMHHGRVAINHLVDHPAHGAKFQKWIMHSRILPAVKQLLGAPPQYTGGALLRTPPHPHRADATRRAELREPDGAGFVWHRGVRPKWATVPAAGQDYIHTTWLNTATFLSDVRDEDDGGTIYLSGSHLPDVGDVPDDVISFGRDREDAAPRPKGVRAQVVDWEASLARREQMKCGEGSVVFFTEALIHSGMAVLSERTRYAMFNDFTVPWMKGTDVPNRAPLRSTVEAAEEGELRDILGHVHIDDRGYVGQWNASL